MRSTPWIAWTRQDSQCFKWHTRGSGRKAGVESLLSCSSADKLPALIYLPISREITHENINEVVKPFDWSYTTDYKGTVSSSGRPFEETTKPIPVELLKRPDPILFFDDVVLYEDELADNGITMLSCKIRVMPERLLLLMRFFMRLDNVLFRLRDTRIYIEFQTMEVTREHQAKECEYEKVRQVMLHSSSLTL